MMSYYYLMFFFGQEAPVSYGRLLQIFYSEGLNQNPNTNKMLRYMSKFKDQ